MYCAYGILCAVLFFQMVRSVMNDVYGRRPPADHQQTPTACLEDVERLYAEISARAVQPAPGGLEADALSREWDTWSRRWEDDLERVSGRCQLGEQGAGKAL